MFSKQSRVDGIANWIPSLSESEKDAAAAALIIHKMKLFGSQQPFRGGIQPECFHVEH